MVPKMLCLYATGDFIVHLSYTTRLFCSATRNKRKVYYKLKVTGVIAYKRAMDSPVAWTALSHGVSHILLYILNGAVYSAGDVAIC